MQRLISIILGGFIIRTLGVNIRYIYFLIIGKRKLREELRPIIKDDQSNLDSFLRNDFSNAIVGASFLIAILLILVMIRW